MPSRVIFLYRSLPEKVEELLKINEAGVYPLEGTILVGIDLNQVNKGKREEIVHDFSLREFEVEQYKFTHIVKLMPLIGARLTNMEVTRSNLHPDMEEELNEAIISQNIEQIIHIIDMFSDLGHDVESVEYFLNKERIRFTRLAELDVDSINPDIYSVLNTTPVAFLSGVVREDEML